MAAIKDTDIYLLFLLDSYTEISIIQTEIKSLYKP